MGSSMEILWEISAQPAWGEGLAERMSGGPESHLVLSSHSPITVDRKFQE